MSHPPAERDPAPSPEQKVREAQAALAHIQQALHGLQFGQVMVIVQDGVVVQVERTEKTRLRRTSKRNGD